MPDEYIRGLEELRQRFSALPTVDDRGPAHKSYVELGKQATNLMKGNRQAALTAGIPQDALDAGGTFYRWRAGVGQLHGPPTSYNPLGSVLVIDKLIAAANRLKSDAESIAASAQGRAHTESNLSAGTVIQNQGVAEAALAVFNFIAAA